MTEPESATPLGWYSLLNEEIKQEIKESTRRKTASMLLAFEIFTAQIEGVKEQLEASFPGFKSEAAQELKTHTTGDPEAARELNQINVFLESFGVNTPGYAGVQEIVASMQSRKIRHFAYAKVLHHVNSLLVTGDKEGNQEAERELRDLGAWLVSLMSDLKPDHGSDAE